MIDFNSIFEQVLSELLPEKNAAMSNKHDWRFGEKGSLSFDTRNLTFYDHETQSGGGLLDLIHYKTGVEPFDWLRQNGYASDTRGQSNKARMDNIISSLLTPTKQAEKQAATYTYVSPEGELLYRVMRGYDANGNRTFKQQRFDHASGQWLNGLKDAQGNSAVTKTLFNLPELVSRPNEVIHVCEGEKDCETLKRLGLLAVTSGGANSWKPEFADWFKNRDVVVFRDNDSTGENYQAEVIESLKGIAKSIKRVNLAQFWQAMPPKADVTDLIEAGASLADLEKIIQHTPLEGEPATATKSHPYKLVKAGEFLREPKPINWLVRDYMEADSMGLIYGASGAGKSLFVASLATAVALGKEWNGKATKQGSVAILMGEGFSGFSRRLKAIEQHDCVDLSDAPIYLSNMAIGIDTDEGLETVTATLDSLPEKPTLIFIDTLARHLQEGDENSNKDVSRLIAGIDQLKARYQCTIIIIHHSGHEATARARGASALKAAMDFSYRVETDNALATLYCDKAKDFTPPLAKSFEIKEQSTGWSDDEGEPINSVLIVPTAGDFGKAQGKALNESLRFAVETFAQVSYQHQATLEEWRNEFYSKHHADGLDAKKKAFARARKQLVDQEVMTVSDDVYQLIPNNPYSRFTTGIMVAANFAKGSKNVGNDDRFHEKDEA